MNIRRIFLHMILQETFLMHGIFLNTDKNEKFGHILSSSVLITKKVMCITFNLRKFHSAISNLITLQSS